MLSKTQERMQSMQNGIDVSKYQGNIDWQKVKASGVAFAMLRAGYGRYAAQKDERFEANYQAAAAAGVPVGAYHYSYATTPEQAKTEAKVFLEWIRGKQFAYPLAYDVEESDQAALGKTGVSDLIRAFCETVEAAGYYVCIYANKYFLDNFVDDDCKRRYDVWVAQWAEKNTYAGSYGMWQYTSAGAVDGISGRVDLDHAYKDYPTIMRENGLNGFPRESDNPNGGASAGTPFPARRMVTLENTPLYVSSTAKTPAARKSGTFYIYDGKELNGRYRITNSVDRCGKKPIGENVTGYVNESDLR